MSRLFQPLTLRGLTLPNRIAVSPMCQYSSVEGLPTDWHLVHYGGLAQGGAGLVIAEAAAVLPEGRITADDLGIWNGAQAEALARIVRFMHAQGAVSGIQLAHAGRKASTPAPWKGSGGSIPVSAGGWTPVGPSALPFDATWAVPTVLDEAGLQGVIRAFADAARRSLDAGFLVAEIHAAHGYLLHQFLSPLSNRREDRYGGSFENRTRLLKEVTEAVRGVWPERLPLFVRLSATDWSEGGWNLEQSIELAKALKGLGVDLVDCSSGGLVPRAEIPLGPGYQVPFAARIRAEAGLPTGAVGLITDPEQAEQILAQESADLVLLARELLRDSRWPLRAAQVLGAEVPWPAPYARAAKGPVPLRQALTSFTQPTP
ncbi:NADH:flavin oxidoreductase/NADH oxidase [Geothrix sp. PMB-07]|uniref:NADH:flavin oxidoreductase/NADH oxidase n=1 Tax=Geothrix sp. PMB-07 TaxID=3068640 RepID=UPI00274106CA|nr:NADH:flavin oxidoreductase/NADH oxidase [Geothrix sp. PMB-07]WLT32371.1 NADH:flavin oxidoreductase/NADH oxidase [Geothrix sp. PMB-07]